jgi:dihydroorotate dehydrogenase electron transfer subunit
MVISQRKIGEDFFLLEIEASCTARMGQFCMLRGWGEEPLLSRPLSVFDSTGKSLSFLYRCAGRGTRLLSSLEAGDGVQVLGPLGRGFGAAEGRIALVGGGAGIAPLFLAAKQLRRPGNFVAAFLGFRGEPVLQAEFAAHTDRLRCKSGGFVTDDVEPGDYSRILACGPEAMLRSLWEKCLSQNAAERLEVSLEGRMACGIGACFACTRKTSAGNRKVCKDGPVFPAMEVF